MTVTSPLGQVLHDDDGMRLEFVRSYDDPVEDVWSALTEPDRVARWFGRWNGDPASGVIEVVMTAEDEAPAVQVRLLECVPPASLVVEMPSPDGTWQLAATLEPAGSGCTLRFVQRLSEPYDASSIGPGWHYYLDRLGAVVTGRPVPEVFDDYFPALADSYRLPGHGD